MTTDLDMSVAVNALRHHLDTATDDLNTFIGNIDAILGLLPAPVAEAAIAQIENGISTPFAGIRGDLDRLLANCGNATALRAAGDVWSHQVERLVSGVGAASNTSSLLAEDRWSGDAATAYRTMIPLQTAACTALTVFATDANSMLRDFAGALESFWTGIFVAVAAFVVSIASAVFAAVTAETGIGFIAGIIAAVSALVVAVGAATTAFTNFNAKKTAEIATLDNRTYSNNGFPNGSWPVSTNNLRDAAILDGDGTDWSLSP